MPGHETIEIKEVPLPAVWTMRQAVMYPAEPLAFVQLEADAAGLHWGLYEQSVLVSVMSAFVDGDSLQFRKFCTLPAWQGRGYGSILLQYMMDWAAQHNIKNV